MDLNSVIGSQQSTVEFCGEDGNNILKRFGMLRRKSQYSIWLLPIMRAVRRNQNTMNKKEINHVTGRIWCNHSSVYTRVLPIIYGLLYRSVCNDGPIAAEQIVFNRLFALEPKHTYLISRGIEISAPIQFAAKIPHEISCLFNKLSVNRKSWMNNIGKTRKTLSEHDKS